ncbi:MAG: 4Fe-4S binding protein [Phycisphaerales bacterium]|nr:4Fe-4S binding protein [Phycisphaerales bacterium]
MSGTQQISARHCDGHDRGRSIALPVLSSDPADKGKHPHGPSKGGSRMGRWRAAVLILVHVAIAIHIGFWQVRGKAVSPVEPSESMQTLEKGVINAGTVFFAMAILSTLLLGRFFCGWACHVVALQDLCTWMMGKVGVRPKPLRSRILVFAPLAIALYMFVWPTVKREVVRPAIEYFGGAPAWHSTRVYLGDVAAWPGWSTEFIVEDFWATFPPWFVAIPFLAICGFAVVYFLGSKGFCTYGCPYGGIFAPADLLAPVRIRVTDDCHQCGHCTAACTSNVRVHEEVRDFGMVVDPGCMKCLDCVSVCPNDALYVGLGRPAILAKTRTPEAKAKRSALSARRFDMPLRTELVIAAVFFGLVVAFRGMFNQVPLLMAMAMGAIGAFGVWKLIQLVREPSVRLQAMQLKAKGRLRPSGAVFGVSALLYVMMGMWSGAVRLQTWRAGLVDDRVRVPVEVAFAPGYIADEQSRTDALKAIALYGSAGPIGEGGFGWFHRPAVSIRLAYLSVVTGDLPSARAHLEDAIERGTPQDQWVMGLGAVRGLSGDAITDVAAYYTEQVEAHPELFGVRRSLAQFYLSANRGADAAALYESALREPGMDESGPLHKDAAAVAEAMGDLTTAIREHQRAMELSLEHHPRADGVIARESALSLARLGETAIAIDGLKRLVTKMSRDASAWHDLAVAHAVAGEAEPALKAMTTAADLDPKEAMFAARAGEIAAQLGRNDEVATWQARAQAASAEPVTRAKFPMFGTGILAAGALGLLALIKLRP